MIDDREFEEHIIEKVEGDNVRGWTITYDGCVCFGVPATSPIEPRPGMVAKFYGRGFGYTVRGLVLDKVVVFYRTEEEEEERLRDEAARLEQKRRDAFERDRADLDARFEKLPEIFRRRIERFRNNNPDFRWKFERYELFCCEQAVVIATALKTASRIRDFHRLDWAQQKLLVPGLDEGHSGNTFGCAVRLATLFVERPEDVVRLHGALAPLVGSKEYGCVPREAA